MHIQLHGAQKNGVSTTVEFKMQRDHWFSHMQQE